MSDNFTTGIEIYNRLVWDGQFDLSTFSIVLKDRFEGSKEISLKAFDADEFPWHRVIQFKQGDTIVWDRDQKIDLLNDSPHLFAKENK